MIQAGSMGVPYIPVIGLAGTDLLRNREDMRVLPDPFDPARHTIVARAYRPDACLLHALRADRAGNVELGRANDDVLLAEASRRVIVTVEEIVERVERREEGGFLPGILVDAVVEAPFGAHPGACLGRYPVDEGHLRHYLAAARGDESFTHYLESTVFRLDSHDQYVERFVPAEWRRGGAGPESSVPSGE
jgi:glutaconate CoA-transferase subunit A